MFSSRRNFLRTLGAAGAAASLPSRFLSAAQASTNEELQARLAADPLRPQFHLLPARNWMNDPDGPIFWNGRYHMFFQYNPNAAVWGDMHWAHAVSPDMIHWKHLPVALAPATMPTAASPAAQWTITAPPPSSTPASKVFPQPKPRFATASTISAKSSAWPLRTILSCAAGRNFPSQFCSRRTTRSSPAFAIPASGATEKAGTWASAPARRE